MKFVFVENLQSYINKKLLDKKKITTSLKLYKKLTNKNLCHNKLNLFYVFIYTKKNLSKFNNFYNKLYCFWPLIKKKLGFVYFKLNFLKKLKSISEKKNTIFKQKNKNKKMYYFNFHRKTIKYFWKSQQHFKDNFLRKTRFTTHKFKQKFEFWYKKNGKKPIFKNNFIYINEFLLRNLVFINKSLITQLLAKKLILKNGHTVKINDLNVNLNDILYLPENYINFLFDYFKSKFNTIKKIKKIKYIYYSNKKSQWKDLKKKTPKVLFYNVYNTSKIYNDVELDFFSSKIIFVKKFDKIFDFNFQNKRHNLEKLNTYKLNV